MPDSRRERIERLIPVFSESSVCESLSVFLRLTTFSESSLSDRCFMGASIQFVAVGVKTVLNYHITKSGDILADAVYKSNGFAHFCAQI